MIILKFKELNILEWELFGLSGLYLSRLATIASIAALPGSAAIADRHCLPSQDGYYTARLELLAEDTPCATRLANATGRLETAVFDAEICGCPELILLLRQLVAVAQDRSGACQATVSSLLNAEETIKATVLSCH